MKGINPHLVELSRWCVNLPKRALLLGQLSVSILAGFFFLHGYMYTVGRFDNLLIDGVLTALFGLMMFSKPLAYAFIAMREYFEIQKLYSELQESSVIDNRTGAYNPNFFQKAGEIITSQAIRNKCSVVCIIVDVDLMKNINDTYGHLAGDASLRAVAQKLIASFRDSDFVVRFGGDEFVVLGYTDQPEQMCHKMANIQAVDISYHNDKGEEMTLTVPVTYGCDYAAVDTHQNLDLSSAEYADYIQTALFKKADAKLYQAKALKKIKRR